VQAANGIQNVKEILKEVNLAQATKDTYGKKYRRFLRFLKMNNNEFANQVKRNGRIRFDDLPELLPLLTIFHQYIVSFKG